MTTILRHGGEAHVVRPDRVYRTGVLTPIVGYQPQADVQAVAAAFTMGPPGAMDLSGLRGLGFFQRLGLRIKSAFAARRANAMMATASSVSGPPIAQTPGPTSQAAAGYLSPDMAGRAQAVFALVGQPGMNRNGGVIARAADVAAMRRNASLYWAG